MEFLHPAMWHDHDIEFARWLHPAMWHVALKSWQWIHQVAAPWNVIRGSGMTCHWHTASCSTWHDQTTAVVNRARPSSRRRCYKLSTTLGTYLLQLTITVHCVDDAKVVTGGGSLFSQCKTLCVFWNTRYSNVHWKFNDERRWWRPRNVWKRIIKNNLEISLLSWQEVHNSATDGWECLACSNNIATSQARPFIL